MSAAAKEYILKNYKTLEREKVVELFKITNKKFGMLRGQLYNENKEIENYINEKCFELKQAGVRISYISKELNISAKIVAALFQKKKDTIEQDLKKERYWKFIQNLFARHKQEVIDLKCETWEDFDILNELSLENKINILPPTGKDCCVRVKLGGINVL